MAVTLKQIAEKTGVSIPTVHQILNNYNVRFSEATRQKVLAAAAELRYTPNLAARSLLQQKSLLVGVLFYGVNYYLSVDFARGLQAALQRRGYSPIFLTHASVEEELANLRVIMQRQVDGVILNVAVDADGSTQAKELHDMLGDTPTVEVFGRFMEEAPNVRLDYETTAENAVNTLINAGHKSIALLVREGYEGPGDRYWSARDFFTGYKKGLRGTSIRANVFHYSVVANNPRIDAHFAGAHAIADQIFTGPQSPTAVLCYTREAAEAIIWWCQQHPDRVPPGMTVAYFGRPLPMNSDLVKLLVFPVPAEDVGRVATDTLFDVMDGAIYKSSRLSPSAGVFQSDINATKPDGVIIHADGIPRRKAQRKTSSR